MIDFLRDQIWQFIGAFLGFVAIILTFVIYRLQYRSKELTVRNKFHFQLIPESQDDLKGKIEIRYENEPVQKVYVVFITIENTGTEPILPTDYIRPITFYFGKNARILTAEVIEQHPDYLEAVLEPVVFESSPEVGVLPVIQENKRTLSKVLLNTGWYIRVKFLISQYNRTEISGLIAGVKEIKEQTTDEKLVPRLIKLSFIPLGLMGTFIIIALILSRFFDITTPIFISLTSCCFGFIIAGIVGNISTNLLLNWRRVSSRKQL